MYGSCGMSGTQGFIEFKFKDTPEAHFVVESIRFAIAKMNWNGREEIQRCQPGY